MIALQAQGPNIRPARNRAAAMEGRNAMMDSQIKELQYGQAVKGMEAQDAIRNALAANPNASMEDVANIYRSHGMVDEAFKLQDQAVTSQTNKLNLTKTQADVYMKQADVIAQVANASQNQDQWHTGIAHLYTNGIIDEKRAREFAGLPYSPELMQHLQQVTLSAKDRLAQQFDREKFTETQRHNLQTEAAAFQRANKPLVSITNSGPKEHDKLDAKYYSEMYSNLQNDERESDKRVMDYKLIDTLIGDAYSGAAGQQVQSVKRAAKILGVDLGDTSGPEAAAMVSNALALQLRNPSGGAGMPGAMSDADRQFLQQMVPGLTTSKEGRQLMVEVQKRIAKRNREVAKLAREYRLQNKYLDVNFEQIIADKFGQQNIFEDLYEAVPATSETPSQTVNPADLGDDDILKGLGLGG